MFGTFYHLEYEEYPGEAEGKEGALYQIDQPKHDEPGEVCQRCRERSPYYGDQSAATLRGGKNNIVVGLIYLSKYFIL